VSYSRFGSDVVHDLAPQAWNAATKGELARHLYATDADLGGTEMEGALRAVLALPVPGSAPADILLITDGETWQSDEVVNTAKASGQRIFAIGVGHAPAHSVVRNIALSTGGACEFATPGEQLGAAALRMLARARQERVNDLRIDWGQDPAWEVKPGASVFGGDTVVAIAGFAEPVQMASVCLHRAGCWDISTTLAVQAGSAAHELQDDTLVRLASALRLERGDLEDAQAQALALQYQLLSDQTHCVLVHERAAEDRAGEPAQTHVVPGMVAHDWHGSASAGAPPVRYARRSVDAMFSCVDAYESQEPCMDSPAITPAHWLRPVFDALLAAVLDGSRVGSLDDAMKALNFHRYVYKAIDKVVAQGVRRDDAWALLARWIATQDNDIFDGFDELQACAPGLSHEASDKAGRVFRRLLAHEPPQRVRVPRAERLRQALITKNA
jgi:hypothetical protein